MSKKNPTRVVEKFPYGIVTKSDTSAAAYVLVHYPSNQRHEVTDVLEQASWMLENIHKGWLISLSPLQRCLYDLGIAKKAAKEASARCYKHSDGWPPSYHQDHRALSKAEKVVQHLTAKAARLCLAEAKKLAA